MNGADSIRQNYHSFLQSLDTKTKAIIIALLAYIKENALSSGNYTFTKQALLNRAIYDFNKNYNDLLTNGTATAIRYAKELKKAELAPYIAEVEKKLSQQDVGIAAASTILHRLEYSQISSVFNGMQDAGIVNKIWYKDWPDGLSVSDRINRLSNKTGQYIEQAVKLGIIAGDSQKEIEKKLHDHIFDGPEQKAMLRLVIHTANMVYEAANAAIANDAPMVKGIRIMRGVDGSPKCEICFSHAGDVGGEGVTYLKNEGDNLDIMAEQPPYHNFCKCEVELIYEDVTTFTNGLRDKYVERQGMGVK